MDKELDFITAIDFMKCMRFKNPNYDNVDLGDLLVCEDSSGTSLILPITEVIEDGVVGHGYHAHVTREYERCVILKRDGSYLVGEDVQKIS